MEKREPFQPGQRAEQAEPARQGLEQTEPARHRPEAAEDTPAPKGREMDGQAVRPLSERGVEWSHPEMPSVRERHRAAEVLTAVPAPPESRVGLPLTHRTQEREILPGMPEAGKKTAGESRFHPQGEPVLRDIRTTFSRRQDEPRSWAENAAPVAIPTAGQTWAGQVELSFAQPAGEQAQTSPVPRREGPKGRDLSALPQWARELMEKPAGPAAGSWSWQGGKAPGGDNPERVRGRAAPGNTIQWTAPGAISPDGDVTSRPASIQYRQRAAQEEKPEIQRRAGLSEAEMQRTADKVYRIIEERLRRELRRSGR